MKGVSVALVVQKVGPNLAIDYGPRSCREANIVQIEDQAVKPALATGTDQVAIFSTVSAKDVSPSFLHVAVPMVSWDIDLLDLAANGKREDVVFVEAAKGRCFWIVDALQPLAAGVSAGIVNVYVELAPTSWAWLGSARLPPLRTAQEGGDLRLQERGDAGLCVARQRVPRDDVLPRYRLHRNLFKPFQIV